MGRIISLICTRLVTASDRVARAEIVNTPELEDSIGVMTSTYEYHSVPDPEVVDARDYEHPPWGVLLEVLVLDS